MVIILPIIFWVSNYNFSWSLPSTSCPHNGTFAFQCRPSVLAATDGAQTRPMAVATELGWRGNSRATASTRSSTAIGDASIRCVCRHFAKYQKHKSKSVLYYSITKLYILLCRVETISTQRPDVCSDCVPPHRRRPPHNDAVLGTRTASCDRTVPRRWPPPGRRTHTSGPDRRSATERTVGFGPTACRSTSNGQCHAGQGYCEPCN